MTPATEPPVLSIEGLTTEFPGRARPTVIVDEVSLALHRGETLAVVGESGSGKTMTFLSALGLVPVPGRVSRGRAVLDGVDLLQLAPEALRRYRGAGIS
ncbi:MAG TPA: ATP-binding cassette domain-containing protein, partial [Hyphomicrobiaceae bacterium]|nr:ATP-binding cassette domain-containing protein [Hyphomicrobiaceae bacterium]